MSNDDIIDLRDRMLAVAAPSVTEMNILRDCDIALRVVRCEDETAAKARVRLVRYRDEGF